MRLLLSLATLLLPSVEATAQGAVKLDNYTFDKFREIPGLTLLVKFDQSYAYGEKEDAFKQVAKLAYSVPNFIVGEVPVQEYGDKDNSDLAERFSLKKDDFPAYYLFRQAESTKFEGFANPAAKKPVNWDEDEDGKWEAPMIKDITAENLLLWLRTQGVKMPSVGTIAELDEIAVRFMKKVQQSDVDEAKKLAEGEHKNDQKAAMYVKIMQRVMEKGTGYIQSESERVGKLLQRKITDEKKAELTEKLKILDVFAS